MASWRVRAQARVLTSILARLRVRVHVRGDGRRFCVRILVRNGSPVCSPFAWPAGCAELGPGVGCYHR
eukprot:2284161-Pleurochrysis_carterae.AAC.1